MDYDKIKAELEFEIENLLQLSENKTANSSAIGKLNAIADHIGKGDEFSKTIVDKLNKILEKNKIDFENEDEKERFLDFIKPTIAESIRRFIRN